MNKTKKDYRYYGIANRHGKKNVPLTEASWSSYSDLCLLNVGSGCSA